MSETRPHDRRVPAYFDYLIEAYGAGDRCRCVHLGWWDTHVPFDRSTPPRREAFYVAQARLDQLIVDWAMLSDHQAVLDVGCGFGGTLDGINRRWRSMDLVGVNIDARQLTICREIAAMNGNHLSWLIADACRLPFASQSFDRVLCVEAMFHFSSRRDFFSEVARVLKPGGIFVASDIVAVQNNVVFGEVANRLAQSLQRGYGPWPDVWCADAEHRDLAQQSGLSHFECLDGSTATRPSHYFTMPSDEECLEKNDDPTLQAAWALRYLHDHEALRYPVMRMRRD